MNNSVIDFSIGNPSDVAVNLESFIETLRNYGFEKINKYSKEELTESFKTVFNDQVIEPVSQLIFKTDNEIVIDVMYILMTNFIPPI